MASYNLNQYAESFSISLLVNGIGEREKKIIEKTDRTTRKFCKDFNLTEAIDQEIIGKLAMEFLTTTNGLSVNPF